MEYGYSVENVSTRQRYVQFLSGVGYETISVLISRESLSYLFVYVFLLVYHRTKGQKRKKKITKPTKPKNQKEFMERRVHFI